MKRFPPLVLSIVFFFSIFSGGVAAGEFVGLVKSLKGRALVLCEGDFLRPRKEWNSSAAMIGVRGAHVFVKVDKRLGYPLDSSWAVKERSIDP